MGYYAKRFFGNKEVTILSIPFISSGADISGNLLNANNFGSVSFTTPVSGVANLGDAKYFLVPNSDLLSFTDGNNDKPFSVEFKIKGTYLASETTIMLLNKRSDTSSVLSTEYQIYFDKTTNTVRFFICDIVNASYIFLSTPCILSSTVEKSLRFVYDGSSSVSGVKIYIDDILGKITDLSTGTYQCMRKTNSQLHIGVGGWSLTSSELSGYIKDLVIKATNPNSDKLTIKDSLSLRLEKQSFPSTTRTIWYDMSGNLTNATLNNSRYDTNAVLFNGTSDFVNIGNILNPLTNNYSVNIIFKTNANGVTYTILSKGNGTSAVAGINIFKSTNNDIIVRLCSNNDINQRADIICGNVTDTNYHMITLVIDRTNNVLIGYLDGVAGTTSLTQSSLVSIGTITTTTNMRLGANSAATFNYLNGGIKSVLIYNNKALTSQEVITLYNTIM